MSTALPSPLVQRQLAVERGAAQLGLTRGRGQVVAGDVERAGGLGERRLGLGPRGHGAVARGLQFGGIETDEQCARLDHRAFFECRGQFDDGAADGGAQFKLTRRAQFAIGGEDGRDRAVLERHDIRGKDPLLRHARTTGGGAAFLDRGEDREPARNQQGQCQREEKEAREASGQKSHWVIPVLRVTRPAAYAAKFTCRVSTERLAPILRVERTLPSRITQKSWA